MYGVVKNLRSDIRVVAFIYVQDVAVAFFVLAIYMLYRRYFYFSVPLHIAFVVFLLSICVFLISRPFNNPNKRNYQLILILMNSYVQRHIYSI
ncbi:DUF5592 family protein [Enterococcus alishanensis]